MFKSTALVLLLIFSFSGLPTGQVTPAPEKYRWAYDDAASQGKIGYVREDIPTVHVSPPKGETYEDMVPDTLDLAERAKLAINVLTLATNQNQDHEQYFSCYIGNPPRMAHNFSDWCTPKYTEALTLLRTATGSNFNDFVDQVWMNAVLKSIGPDGLYYFPIVGKPWYGKELWWADGIARADGFIFVTEPPDEEFLKSLDTYAVPHAHSAIQESGITQFAHPQPSGRIINILNIYYMRDGNPIWKETIERMIDRLLEVAIHKDDYCYFPPLFLEPHARFDPDDPRTAAPKRLQGGEINGRCIKGPALFYRLTGYEPARELARKLTNFMRYHNDYYGPNGEFLADKHFHAHTNYLFQMLEYAVAAGDAELKEFVRKGFEWAMSPEAGTSSLTGFIPEFAKPYRTTEGCASADMIALALKLSEAGAGDYYQEAERWARNYFAELQLTKPKVDHLVRWGKTMEKKDLLYNETDDRVAERSIGAFASWTTGNEWLGGDERGSDNLIMHCCTGNGTRTVYYLWRHILDYKDQTLRVNMLLNRASPWADVHSYVPYEGKVDIKIKTPCRQVLVHAPEWIPSGEKGIVALLNGEQTDFSWKERYLDLGRVEQGKTVQIQFPIHERTVRERIGLDDYTLIVKGNTVVFIDPPGRNCPLFQREHYREDQVRWRKVVRFVPNTVLPY